MHDLQDILAAFNRELGLAKTLRLHRKLRAAKEAGAPLAHKAKVAVLSNFSTQFLVQGLELAMAQRGIDAELYESGYNQWQHELLSEDAGYLAIHPDVVLVSLTSMFLAFRDGARDPVVFAERLGALIRQAQRRTSACFVVTLPEPLEEEMEQTGWALPWRKQLVKALEQALPSNVVRIELAPLIRAVGSENWYSARFFVNSKLPFNPERTARLADYLASVTAAIIKRPVRLIVVDLDDTLWGGIVGEEGCEGVNLDAEDRGFAHLRLQRFLLGLHHKGVLLAVVSKNNREDALEVFRKRPEMLLKEEHFTDMRINWEPKSQNLRSILDRLNLTAGGTVFIDDSPFERGEIQRMFPEVFVPDFPEDPVDLVPRLAATGRFSIPITTTEDLGRQQMYREEAQRRERKLGVTDLSEYYLSLGLVLSPHSVGGSNEQRVVDLLSKTNQFNLTTRRHTRDALRGFVSGEKNQVWAFSLKDDLGNYGVIAVVIGVAETEQLRIDTWLMSCRVMGRTVENAIFRFLFDRSREAGFSRIVGEYIPTKKNPPVAKLYAKLGFETAGQEGEALLFQYTLGEEQPDNRFVVIEPLEKPMASHP